MYKYFKEVLYEPEDVEFGLWSQMDKILKVYSTRFPMFLFRSFRLLFCVRSNLAECDRTLFVKMKQGQFSFLRSVFICWHSVTGDILFPTLTKAGC